MDTTGDRSATVELEGDAHARVLLALHQEFLAYGLKHDEGVEAQTTSSSLSTLFKQSAAGAFSPLRYVDVQRGGRVIVVHALAMFDNLIVNATAAGGEGLGGAAAAGGECGVRRRTKFNVCRWSLATAAAATAAVDRGGPEVGLPQQHQGEPGQENNDGVVAAAVATPAPSPQKEEAAAAAAAAEEEQGEQGTGASDDEAGKEQGQGEAGGEEREGGASDLEAAFPPCAASTVCAPPPPQPPQPPQPQPRMRWPSSSRLEEEFRSRVLSGLLLHLCPPPGHFADLFGCGEDLRRRILGLLGARDLASFGLANKAAAASATVDSLWAPLVAADFSESEQDALRNLPPPPPPLLPPSHAEPQRSTIVVPAAAAAPSSGQDGHQPRGRTKIVSNACCCGSSC
ncbi:unnamed protein product, partial [Pylaiella littoralis]